MKKYIVIIPSLLLLAMFFLFPTKASAQAVCSGGGYYTGNVGTCEWSYFGSYCSNVSQSGGYASCGWSGPSCTRLSRPAGLWTYCNDADCSITVVNDYAGSYTTSGCSVSYTATSTPVPPPPTFTPSPTPIPPDFNITEIRTVDVDGVIQTTFRTGQRVSTRIMLENEGPGLVRQNAKIGMYRDEASPLPVGTASDIPQYINTGNAPAPGDSDLYMSSINNPRNLASFEGDYSFVPLIPGTYTLQAFADYDNRIREADEGNNHATRQYEVVGQIDGVAFRDMNNDRKYDVGEPLIPGVEVRATKRGGADPPGVYNANVGTDTTNGSGRYIFPNRSRGEYRLQVISIPAGYQLTGANPKDTTLGPDKAINFSFIPLAGPTPTPLPAANLDVTQFYLMDRDGNVKTQFYTGERIYPHIEFTNITNIDATTPDTFTYSEVHANRPSFVPNNVVSAENVHIRNGTFRAGFSDDYYCAPTPGNKCNVFTNQQTFAQATPGSYTARVVLNFNQAAPESSYGDNQASRAYTVIARPGTPTPTGTSTPTPTPGSALKSIAGGVYLNGNLFSGTTPVIRHTNVATSATGTVSAAGGTYVIPNLPQGRYQIRYENYVPGVYTLDPTLGLFVVTIGDGGICQTPRGGCINGSIVDLDFQMSDNFPWYQTKTFDTRIDPGYSNRIPSTANVATCGGPVASASNPGGTPGVIYTGASTAFFGDGSPSTAGWLAGGNSHQSTFGGSRPLRTSHNILRSTILNSGTTINAIGPGQCNGGPVATCNLRGATNGAYSHNGNIQITSGDIDNANKKMVLLVNGSVNITGPINVATGGYLLISATGDISVGAGIGGASTCGIDPQLEGIYVTNSTFRVNGASSCPATADSMLTMGGTVVVNADISGGGSFINSRNLCDANSEFPSVRVVERPDFVLSAPDYIQSRSTVWREIAP